MTVVEAEVVVKALKDIEETDIGTKGMKEDMKEEKIDINEIITEIMIVEIEMIENMNRTVHPKITVQTQIILKLNSVSAILQKLYYLERNVNHQVVLL